MGLFGHAASCGIDCWRLQDWKTPNRLMLRRRRFHASTAIAAVLAVAAAAPGRTANLDWTGAVSNDWSEGGNWSSGVVPAAGDNVTINIVSPVTINIGGTTPALGDVMVGGGGTLNIANGKIVSQYASIGSKGSALAIVNGTGSSWNITYNLFVASTGAGTLQIEDGATVSAGGARIGSAGSSLSGAVSGFVTVTGAGSLLNASGDIYLGGDGADPKTPGPLGVLTIANAGKVSAQALWIATQTGSTGTLNIGAAAGQPPVAPGTLDATQVIFGRGTGRIVFNHTASDYIFTPVITTLHIGGGGSDVTTGSGEVEVHAGTTTLTATNTYSGATNVYGGTLLVNGSIGASSLTTVSSGGTLGGTGTVGHTTIASGGTFAPGNGTPGSSIVLAGNLAFQSGAFYVVQLDPSAATSANVTGAATLGDATVKANFAPGSYVAKQYVILHAAGGVSGAFSGLVNINLPANVTSSLSYDANNAYLDLSLYQSGNLNGLNQNQRAVADTLSNYFDRTGGIPGAFASLAPQSLTQASGELGTGTQQTTFQAMNSFLGLMTDPFGAGRSHASGGNNGPLGYADQSLSYSARGQNSQGAREAYAAYMKAPPFVPTHEPRWSVWAAGYGGTQTTDGNAAIGSSNTTSSIYGVAVGADHRVSPDTIFGFAVAGGGTHFRLADGLGSGRSDLFQAGAYFRHAAGPAYLIGGLAYGWQDVTTDRTVTIAASDPLRAKFHTNAVSGRLEGGYRHAIPWMAVTPYAAGQFTTLLLPAYAEQASLGGSTFALSYASKDVTASRSELGIRTDKSFALDKTLLTLRGRLAWAHDFNSDRNITATFQTLPGASFVVNGARPTADSALVTASAEFNWLNGFSMAAAFEGEFSNAIASYAAKGVFKYIW